MVADDLEMQETRASAAMVLFLLVVSVYVVVEYSSYSNRKVNSLQPGDSICITDLGQHWIMSMA